VLFGHFSHQTPHFSRFFCSLHFQNFFHKIFLSLRRFDFRHKPLSDVDRYTFDSNYEEKRQTKQRNGLRWERKKGRTPRPVSTLETLGWFLSPFPRFLSVTNPYYPLQWSEGDGSKRCFGTSSLQKGPSRRGESGGKREEREREEREKKNTSFLTIRFPLPSFDTSPGPSPGLPSTPAISRISLTRFRRACTS
jgi:hypothetical protein